MQYNDQHRFKQSVDALTAMYFTQRYHEEKYRLMKATEVSVLSCTDTPERFEISVRYTTTSDAPLPDVAKKVIGESITVTQTDRWDRKALKGSLQIEIKGAPVKIGAEMLVKPDGQGSANHFVWEVKCGIPLIGGKIEKVLMEDVKIKATADAKRSQQLLDGWK